MTQQQTDAWHQLEAADERAWLDQWARAQADIGHEFYGRKTPATAGRHVGRTDDRTPTAA